MNSIMQTNNSEIKRLINIWSIMKKQSAKESILSKDRANNKLTEYEIYDKLCKQGYVLKHKDIKFFYENSMGCLLKADGTGVVNATMQDFINEIKKTSGAIPYWAKDRR